MMTENTLPITPKKNRRWLKWLGLVSISVLLILGAIALWLGSSNGQSWLLQKINSSKTESGFGIKVGGVKGSLFSNAELTDVHLRDIKGDFLVIETAQVLWHPRDFLSNTINIESADIASGIWLRRPEFRVVDPNAPLLPKQDIRIGRLTIRKLILGPDLIGKPYALNAKGTALIKKGIVNATLNSQIIDSNDRANLKLLSEPDRNKFDIDMEIAAAPRGPLAILAKVPDGFSANLKGGGDFKNWRGTLLGKIAAAPIATLSLTHQNGTIRATGIWAAPRFISKQYRTIADLMPNIDAQFRFDNKKFDGNGQFFGKDIMLRWQADANLVDSTIATASAVLADKKGALSQIIAPKLQSPELNVKATATGTLRQPDLAISASAAKLAWDQYGISAPRITSRSVRSENGTLSFITSINGQNAQTGLELLNQKLRQLDINTIITQKNNTLTAYDLKIKGNDLSANGDFALSLANTSWRSNISDLRTTMQTEKLGLIPLQLRGALSQASPTANIAALINGTSNLTTWSGPAQIVKLFGRAPQYSANLSIAPSGATRISKLQLVGNGNRFTGDGSIINRALSGTILGTIENVRALVPSGPLANIGSVPITLVLGGTLDAPRIQAELQTEKLAVSGIILNNIRLALQPLSDQTWQARFTARAPLGDADIQSNVHIATTTQLKDISGRIGDIDLSGALDIAANGIASGKIILAQRGAPSQLSANLLLSNQTNAQFISGTFAANEYRGTWNGAPLIIGKALGTVQMSSTENSPLKIDLKANNIAQGDWQIKTIAATASGPLSALQGNYAIIGTRGPAFDMKGDISSARLKPSGTALKITAAGSVGGQSIRLETPAQIILSQNGWKISPTKISFSGGSAITSASSSGDTLVADLELSNSNLALLQLINPTLGFTGTASGAAQISLKAGKLTAAKGDIQFKRFRRAGVFLSSAPINGNAVFALDKSALTGTFNASANNKQVGSARLALMQDGAGNLRSGNLLGTAQWNGPAEALWGLIGTDANDVRGPLKISANISGTGAAPSATGTVEMRGGRYENVSLGMIINNVDVDGRFVGPNLAITRASGNLSAGGSIEGNGTVDLSLERGLPSTFQLQLRKAAVLKRDDLEAVVSGPVTVNYSSIGGSVSGKLSIDRARIRAGSPTAEAIADISVREINKPRSVSVTKQVVTNAKPWALDLTLNAAEKIFISGLGLNSEWSGSVNVAGTSTAPRLLGRMQILRGEYEFAGRRFNVDRGDISFQGAYPINPVLAIQASARAGDSTAIIRIAGTALRPNIAFTAQPSLPQDEILSRLLFGTSVQSLSALEAVQLAAALNQLGSAKGGLNVMGSIKRATGIDRLRVLPADAATGRSAALSGGKYLTDRIYLEVATDGRGYTATTIEVDVTRTLSILSQIATLGGTNVGVKWSKDY